MLKLDGEMLRLAEQLKGEQSLLVFGRGYNYATALEAALKVRPAVSGVCCSALEARHDVVRTLNNQGCGRALPAVFHQTLNRFTAMTS